MTERSFGWAGRILEVDLTHERISRQRLPGKLSRRFIGQSGINAALLHQMAPRAIRPLDPEAPLIFGVGPLGGTAAPCSGRFSLTFKSPLTGIFADSNCGGHFGPELKMAGYDHIVIKGKARRPVYLCIDNDSVRLNRADHLWGLNTWDTEDEITSELRDRTFQIASIGSAGENLVLFAAVISNKSRAAARCGPGAVMGSKNLKAVAVRGDRGLRVHDPVLFQENAQQALESILDDPLYSQASTYGTSCITGMAQALGFLPTRNFQASTFDGAAALYGDTIAETCLQGRKGCYNCPVSCSKYCSVAEGPYAGARGEGPEYETISAFGSKCGNDDLASVLQANMLCNQLGLDTISTGNTIAWAMECSERGIFDSKSPWSGLRFGDHSRMIELIQAIAGREGVGDILAQGTLAASGHLGGRDRVVHSKGLDYPAVDVRGTKGMALAFAVSPRGGDHLKGLPLFEVAPDLYAREMEREIGISPGDGYWLDYASKPELIRWHEDWHCVVDSLGLCKLEGIAIKPLFPHHFRNLLQAATGWEVSHEELRLCGERIWTLERLFNIREGLGTADDLPPQRLLTEPISTGPAKGEVLDRNRFQDMLNEYYELRGWDRTTGAPLPGKCLELGLDFSSCE
ncbi:MAG: aldehyde ferredoxin oxidoreductase family protein [Thermodesulfobacteriota bacterium]